MSADGALCAWRLVGVRCWRAGIPPRARRPAEQPQPKAQEARTKRSGTALSVVGPMPNRSANATATRPAPHVVLRALRGASGLTQQGWAAWLGYSVATVRRWENGRAAPTAEAEAALLSHCQQRGLFRTFVQDPLRDCTLTPELLRELLAEARLQGNRPHAGGDDNALQRATTLELPTGTVTFLLTDVVGSTSAWLRNRQAMSAALERHDAVTAQ